MRHMLEYIRPLPLLQLPLILPLLVLLFFPEYIAAQNVEFEPGRWNLEQAEVKEHRGRNCLTGTAFLKNVKLKDGVVEVDVLVTDKTSYPGIIFRRSSDNEFERIYLRPHRAGHYPDAVQYTPTFNGMEAWQLYNGPGYTAACELSPDTWIRLRLEFRDAQARLFIGGNRTPALVVQDLKHSPVHGTIGLDAPRDGGAYFSRFSYHEDAALEFPAAPAQRILPGTITHWELSRVFKASAVDMERTLEQQKLQEPRWEPVESEASGLVNIARFRARTGGDADCVWARTTVRAAEDGPRELQFGYSDAISIFCNGRLLFAGSSAYRERDPSFLGIAGYFDAVYLPLEEGENELLICVAESSGGWGFMARDADTEMRDVMLEPRWDLKHQLRFPESVAYDAARKVFYVSNFFDDGNEFISKITPEGDVLALRWAGGLERPTGLAMHADRLYAVDRKGVAVINPASGMIEKRIEATQAQFLNDIAFDEAGIGYVTDSRANRILKLEDGRLAPWLEGAMLGSPNGIWVENGNLLVGNSDDAMIKAMNLATKDWRPFAQLDAGTVIDGLTGMGDGRILASDHAGRVFVISPSGKEVRTILDRSTTRRFCADFAYVPALKLLLIPSLQENSLTAFTLP
jgi:hypothetical protein